MDGNGGHEVLSAHCIEAGSFVRCLDKGGNCRNLLGSGPNMGRPYFVSYFCSVMAARPADSVSLG